MGIAPSLPWTVKVRAPVKPIIPKVFKQVLKPKLTMEKEIQQTPFMPQTIALWRNGRLRMDLPEPRQLIQMDPFRRLRAILATNLLPSTSMHRLVNTVK